MPRPPLFALLLASLPVRAAPPPVCEALRAERPAVERVRTALAAAPAGPVSCPPKRRRTSGVEAFLFVTVPPLPLLFRAIEQAKARAVPASVLAIRTGDTALVQLFLDRGPPPEGALEVAVEAEAWAVVDQLLSHGVPPSLTRIGRALDAPGNLVRLQERGISLAEVEVIVGYLRSARDPPHAVALMDAGLPAAVLFRHAVAASHVDIANTALARLEATPARRYQLLLACLRVGRRDQAAELRAAGVPWSFPGHPSATEVLDNPYHLRTAMALGLDPAAAGQGGGAVLRSAVDRKLETLAVVLIGAGVGFDAALVQRAEQREMWRVVHAALVRAGDEARLRALAEAGHLDGVVGWLAADGDVAGLRHLLGLGARPGGLLMAADAATTQVLLDAGADPSPPPMHRGRPDPQRGTTPLGRAVTKQDAAMLRALLDAGARSEERGLVARALATDPALADALLDAGFAYSRAALLADIAACDTARMARHAWPELPRRQWMAAAREAGCLPAVKHARKGAGTR